VAEVSATVLIVAAGVLCAAALGVAVTILLRQRANSVRLRAVLAEMRAADAAAAAKDGRAKAAKADAEPEPTLKEPARGRPPSGFTEPIAKAEPRRQAQPEPGRAEPEQDTLFGAAE
jgi:hypothetical protein